MKQARLNVYVAPAAHRVAKMQAVRDGSSLSELVENAIFTYVGNKGSFGDSFVIAECMKDLLKDEGFNVDSTARVSCQTSIQTINEMGRMSNVSDEDLQSVKNAADIKAHDCVIYLHSPYADSIVTYETFEAGDYDSEKKAVGMYVNALKDWAEEKFDSLELNFKEE